MDGIQTAGKLRCQVIGTKTIGTIGAIGSGSFRAAVAGSASQLNGHCDTAHGDLLCLATQLRREELEEVTVAQTSLLQRSN